MNKATTKVPQMKLMSTRELLDAVFAHKWGFQADAKSWFYQVPLHPCIQEFFVFRVGGVFLKFAVMVQGWKGAPAVAQTLS